MGFFKSQSLRWFRIFLTVMGCSYTHSSSLFNAPFFLVTLHLPQGGSYKLFFVCLHWDVFSVIGFVYQQQFTTSLSWLSLCYKSTENVSSALKWLNAPAEPPRIPWNTTPCRSHQSDRFLAPKPVNDEDVLKLHVYKPVDFIHWILIT